MLRDFRKFTKIFEFYESVSKVCSDWGWRSWKDVLIDLLLNPQFSLYAIAITKSYFC